MPEWLTAPLISSIVAFCAFVFALVKYSDYAEAEREKLKTAASDARHAEFTNILEEHKNEFKRMNEEIKNVEKELTATRDELHRDYAKVNQMHALRMELKEDFDKVFKRLSDISGDLNQLIGKSNNGN